MKMKVMMMMMMMVSSLLLTCVCSSSRGGAVFVYSAVGTDVLLPCPGLKSSDCSLVSWTFFRDGLHQYTQEVSAGRVWAESERAGRLSVTAGCSLRLAEVGAADAGSYGCRLREAPVGDAYLSLLWLRVHSPVSALRPGGHLVLSCLLLTYYDTGSCKPYTSQFRLSWRGPDGAPLTNHSRLDFVSSSRCNITLSTKLQLEDHNRKWRCQVEPQGNRTTVAAFQDFTSAFLFQAPPPLSVTSCPAELPVSRVVLCVALPLMVLAVGFFTWCKDRRAAKTSGIELREVE